MKDKDNSNNINTKELLGHKRKEDKENITEESYKVKKPIPEEEIKNIKDDEQKSISNKINDVPKNENIEENGIMEEEANCEKCDIKKKVFKFNNIENILSYTIKNNLINEELKNIFENNKNIQFNGNKKFCEECLKLMVTDKNNLENFIQYLNEKDKILKNNEINNENNEIIQNINGNDNNNPNTNRIKLLIEDEKVSNFSNVI